MKSDCIVLGSELDSLVAAARLAELGCSVQLLSQGAGSLHYAPAGVHVLGYVPGAPDEEVTHPYASMGRLDRTHPYRKLGTQCVADALAYFAGLCDGLGMPLVFHDVNQSVVTPTGLGIPALGVPPGLATQRDCAGRSVAIVDFDGFRDFPHPLLAAELASVARGVTVVTAALPGSPTENVAVARAFDGLRDPRDYFAALRARMPAGVEVVLFPAVLGLARHSALLRSAQGVFGCPCLEVATLPASVPGRRLEAALRRHLQSMQVDIVLGFRFGSATLSTRGVELTDADGRRFKAQAAVLATGGVLMGGLEVHSTGRVRETVFDLAVEQTAPLSTGSIHDTLEALHHAGARTSDRLNPFAQDGTLLENVFVTGQTLSGFNPAQEASSEGVSIATGWSAANFVHTLLREPAYA